MGRKILTCGLASALIGAPLFTVNPAEGSPAPLDARHLAELAESRQASQKWESRDRAELIRPTARQNVPQSKGRHLKLTLIPRDKTILLGGEFWYRLELRNVGSKPIRWAEMGSHSFFKVGALSGTRVRFIVTDPEGVKSDMLPPLQLGRRPAQDIRLPSGLSKAEREAAISALNDPRATQLSVTLQPGETLVSRPWRPRSEAEVQALILAGKDPDSAIAGDFRILPTRYTFSKPGKYQVSVEIDNSPPPLEGLSKPAREAALSESLGVLRTLPITIEVIGK